MRPAQCCPLQRRVCVWRVFLYMESEVRGPTVTSHALVYEAVEKGATVVAEGRAGVGVDLELVLRPRVLGEKGGGGRSVTLKRD